jgi:molybdopterin molybdotransferase
MLPLAEAHRRLADAVEAITETVDLPITEALDKILAVDIKSELQVPSYDNSAMDGYALRIDDLQQTDTLTLAGKSFAGSPFEGTIEADQCIRIMTGAQVPADADTVIMQEKTNAQGDTSIGDQITFSGTANKGSNIRRAGEDIEIGATIIQQGRRLSPTDIGLLASIGVASVTVFRTIKVGIFSTGDELRLPGQQLDAGCIYESNRFVVSAMLQRLGAEIFDLGIIPDQPEALEQAFLKASSECDAVISSGGVSVGEADYTKTILDKIGTVGFWKVAIKPGKPFAFGTIGHLENGNTNGSGSYFFGLPGNPVSATVTFHQLALPVLRQLAGETLKDDVTLEVIAQQNIRKSPGRTDFQRGNLVTDDRGNTGVTTTGSQGSGILSSISNADCYLVLEKDHGNYETGDTVTVKPFDRWLG